MSPSNRLPLTPGTTRLLRRLLPVLALTLLASTPAAAQDLDAQVDRLFTWVTPTTPGCAVAASLKGKPVVSRTYGLADLERAVPITSESVFDAGSVVKQFVAAATLLLVQDGRLSLTEDVHAYLPELPDYGRPITLDQLMTHTSGIRDWTGLGPLTGRSIDALTLTLRQRQLDFSPGDEWAYSNGGYVLLKEIVARRSGMTFGKFAQARLFDPLGMKNTAYVADLRTVVRHRALAYEKAGNGWRLDVQFDNDRGGGGALLSTPADLLIWNDALADKRLGGFVTEKLEEPARLNNGRTLGYGRGLFLDRNGGGRVLWHSGGAAGYGTFLVRFPEQGLSVASMCNAGEAANGSAYARRIFELVVPATASAAETSAGPDQATRPAAAVDVTDKAGLFFEETDGRPLRLAAEKGRLRLAGGPVLDSIDASRFRLSRPSLSVFSHDQFELHFVSPDQIEMRSMEGTTTRYRRARAVTPSADELTRLAGRYSNDETKAVLQLAAGKQGLLVHFNDLAPMEFQPVDRDTFQRGRMLIRMRRDTDGRIAGLDYSNPLVRRVAFTKAGEPMSSR